MQVQPLGTLHDLRNMCLCLPGRCIPTAPQKTHDTFILLVFIRPCVYVEQHVQVKESFDPLLKHWLAVARDKETRPADFKAAIQNIAKIALFECADRVIPTKRTQVQTPMDAPAEAQYVDSSNPVCIVPVLRAGIVMSEALEAIMPVSVTYHLGYVRDEETLEATPYLNKLPESFDSNSKILLLDIMIATGTDKARVSELNLCTVHPGFKTFSRDTRTLPRHIQLTSGQSYALL